MDESKVVLDVARQSDRRGRERERFLFAQLCGSRRRKKGQINREIAQRNIELDGKELGGGDSKAR